MASEQRCMQWHTVQVLHLGSISLAPQGSKVLCWVSSLSALSPKGHANCFMGAKEAQWSRFLFLFVFVSNVLSFRDQYLHQGGGIRFFFFCVSQDALRCSSKDCLGPQLLSIECSEGKLNLDLMDGNGHITRG